ncbi:MAG: sodium:solute symporter, partial [Planctomycetota bacterium]
ARGSVLVLGLAAYAIAGASDSVMEMIDQTSGFGASIFVCVTFGLFTRFGGEIAARMSLIVGTAVWVVGALWLEWDYPFLAALGASVAAYGLGSWFDRGRPRATVLPSRAASAR